MGSSGRGPARLDFNNASATFFPKKPAVLGANVFKNWNKDITSDKPVRQSSRKYVKVMKRGVPAPDINKLVLLDPTLARKPHYPNFPPTKTPFELIQNSLRDDGNESPADGFMPIENSKPGTAGAMTVPTANPSESKAVVAAAKTIPNVTDSNIPESVAGSPAVAQDPSFLKDGEVATFMEGASSRQPSSVPQASGSTVPDAMEETTPKAPNPTTDPEFGEGSGETAARKKTIIAISEWRDKFLVPKPPGAPEVPAVKVPETMDEASSVNVAGKAIALMETPGSNTGDANAAETATRAWRFGDVRPQPQNSPFDAPAAQGEVHPAISGAVGSPTTSSATRDLEAELPAAVMMEENHDNDNSPPPWLRAKLNPALNPAKGSRPGVNGVLFIGEHHEEIGLVKMMGLGSQARKLFTNIQEGPNRLMIWFQEICGAVNYRAFYHSVSNGLHSASPNVKEL